jgi:hypothetical protein
MATIKTSDGDVELFGPSDIYRYDIDNRPLRNLIDNDDAINTELVATTAEVQQARTGLQQTYSSLDARLDDLELAAGYPQKQIAFNEFMARAKAWQARYASGMLFPVVEVMKTSDIRSSFELSGLSVPLSGFYGLSPFGQIFLRDEDVTKGTNRVFLGNGNNMRVNSGTGAVDFLAYRPVYVNVGGMLVALYDEAGGASTSGITKEVCWNLPAAPSANLRVDLLWIEVWLQNVVRSGPSFYPYGAVGSQSSPLTSADDPTLRGNVGFYGGNNGDYFQLRHRLRVSTVAAPDYNPFGMSDQTNVLAQGGNSSVPGSPTARNVFVAAQDTQGDPSLWVAGTGDSTSKSELGTIDGYVYAVPVALVFRRNTGQWTISNQNGTKTSGGNGSWATEDSARPDYHYHDKIEFEDLVILAPSTVSERTNLNRILEESFDRLLRGELHTRHGYLDYVQLWAEDTISGTNETVGGGEIVGAYSLASADQSKTRQFKGGDAVNLAPNDFQRLYSAQTEEQVVGFTINLQSSTGTPSNFAAVSGSVLSLKSSGQSVGNAGTAIYEAPLLWWSGSKKPVALTGSWTGLGTAVLSATLDTGDTNYSATGTIVGFARVYFPAMNGVNKAVRQTVGQSYTNPSASTLSSKAMGLAGTENLLAPTGIAVDATYMYVCDRLCHKAWKINRTSFAVAASFGVYGVSGSDNTHLKDPAAISLDGSGNVYIADASNHRVIKLNSSMVYQGQFGVTNTPGTDNSHLNTPQGVAVDGSGNIYISDTLNYRIMKVSGAFSYISSYGVVGVSVPDNTHCVFPRHAYYGDDSYLYVTDRIRIIVMDAGTMVPAAFIQNGYSIPAARINSVQSVDPHGSVNEIREDSSGNKYALTSSGIRDFGGHVGFVLTKYDSTWGFLARYGAAWDADGALWGGVNAGTKNGLVFPADFVLDEPNDAIHIFEANDPGDAVNMASSGVVSLGSRQNRVISIKMSDLSLYQVRYADNTTGTGSATPYGPIYGNRYGNTINPAAYGLQYPECRPTSVEFDPVNHYIYIAYGGNTGTDYENAAWTRIEKWSATNTDPATWTCTAYFGYQQIRFSTNRYIWQAWTSPADDNTRLLHISSWGQAIGIADDGSGLYVVDNNTVIKLNSSGATLTYVGRFGSTTVPGSDTAHLNFVNIGGRSLTGQITVMCASTTDANGRIYVLDNGNQRLMILKDNGNFNTSGSTGAYSAQWTYPRIQLFPTLMGGRSYALTTGAGKLWFKDNTGCFEVNVAGSYRDTPQYVDANASAYASIYVPLTLLGYAPEIGGNDFFGISKLSGGNIFWSDWNTQQLICVSPTDYYFVGKCGVPGTGGFDGGSWMRPTGIAVYDRYLYLCDHNNGRILIVDQHAAYVEPQVGRTEFLIAPEVSSKWYAYIRFTPLQGVYQRGKPTNTWNNGDSKTQYPRLTGKNMLLPPQKMLVTTMGQGTSEGLLNDPGVIGYANCIQRLPLPVSGFDERAPKPTEFPLTGTPMMARAHYYLPILNSISNFRGRLRRENESFWQSNTLLSYANKSVTYNGLKGGFRSLVYVPGPTGLMVPVSSTGPTLATFSCATAPNYRYVAVPFLVVVEGEILMAVRVQCFTSTALSNELGESYNEVVELYRAVGHPMLPHRGDTDDAPVVV